MVDFKRLIDLYTEPGARVVFENMCAELLAEEYPGTKQIKANPGDRGIDCIQYDPAEESAIVFQCKYFPYGVNENQQKQIRESYKSVYNYLGKSLVRWILVLPINMDTNELKWFRKWKAKQSEVDIDCWGEAKLRSLLAKYSHIEENCFQLGIEKNFRMIVSFQTDLIVELRKGFERIDPRPQLKLMFLASDGCLSEEVTISKREFEKYKTLEPKSESEIKRICDLYDGLLDEDQIRKIMNCYNSKITPSTNKLNEEKEAIAAYKNPNFVVFAVLNEGEEPARDVRVHISFPPSLFVYPYNELGKLEERLPQSPDDPEQTILRIVELRCMPKDPKLPIGILQSDLTNSTPNAPDIPSSSIFKIFGDIAPEKIIVNSQERSAQFCLGKVMHDGHYSSHKSGILIAPLEEGSFEVTYNIIADNIRSEVEGVLRITTSEEIGSLEEWDPINE